ncbi:thioredoxin fold domain-containing protein [Butyricimonas sp. Marseille-P3923]|uniref:thioredoxin family protein n=1 Tax=Butyricimonas sp. Marseille-P3923 TaxID=1987504 RepID=UPI0020FFFBA5|nr:thioredoxin fold domain-containing protein [Butyricimonas sp. Marseille-P3923]
MGRIKYVLVFLLMGMMGSLSAQITFFQGTFEEALKKAKAEKKDVFVDFYTEWCGPCKVMSQKVFTVPEVGDYFNTHFVSCKLNAEASEQAELVKKYGVEAFPTMIFVNVKGEVLRVVRGAKAPAALLNEAKMVTGDMLTFEKLYEKSKKEKKNTDLQQELLFRAPEFIATQTGYNRDKWMVRIEALFPEYVKNKKLENMINAEDLYIISMYHNEIKGNDEIFDFLVKNYRKYGEIVGKEKIQDFILGVYNNYILSFCRNGKQDYKKHLERVKGDLQPVYSDISFGSLSAFEAISLLADGYYSLFRKDINTFFEKMNQYFSGAEKALTVNDYTQPIEDLYTVYRGNLPEGANEKVIAWLDKALQYEMAAQLRTRLLYMLGDCFNAMGNLEKAKQSLNQAFVVSSGIEDVELMKQLQNMIQEKLREL